jgi:hypothetical protein
MRTIPPAAMRSIAQIYQEKARCGTPTPGVALLEAARYRRGARIGYCALRAFISERCEPIRSRLLPPHFAHGAG